MAQIEDPQVGQEAQTEEVALYRLPDSLVTRSANAITLNSAAGTYTYIEGIGWSPALDEDSPQPVVTADGVFAPAEFFEALGLTTQRVEGVRFGGDSTLRAVVDVSEGTVLDIPEQSGRLAQDEVLTVRLPNVLLPQELPDSSLGVELELFEENGGVTLSVSGPELNYSVFTLENPSRLVLDITPLSFATVTPETRELANGVTYRRFAAPTTIGSSGVHLLEIAPGRGEFRVVGANKSAAAVSELARGSLAAINAGYFDRSSLDAIGFLKVDNSLLSLPSRGRTSIGFGTANLSTDIGGVLMDRLNADVNVRVSGKLFNARDGEAFTVYTQPGAFVGTGRQGVIEVQNGRVLLNKVGPRVVPPGGFAIVYSPEERELALVDEGDFAALDIQYSPAPFGNVRYAVEAGPLLIKNARPAFAPELEQFRRGERILDHYTQQAAIGVRADGTVLLVAADNMIAEDLIPLFTQLGASEAARLDSGGSTTLYANGEVLNRVREREVVSAIIYVPYP